MDIDGAIIGSTLLTGGIYLYNFYFLAWTYVFQQLWFVGSLVAFLFMIYVVYREEQRALIRPERAYMVDLGLTDQPPRTSPDRVRSQLRR
ncbi:MAG: hypothetical protein KJ734_03220 [Chloroflexi bacterium]|nr:hypothetical protein [Chloroflexota bacterium]